MTKEFDPNDFLSSLNNRHQTLEDLRTELRTRNQDLSKELLDLVNENYQDFLTLGSSLKGGDDKVEDAIFGLLSFRKEIANLKGKVEERKLDVQDLVEKRKQIREEVQLGRQLLRLNERINDLERRLMLASIESPQDHRADTNREPSVSEGESEEDGDADTVGLPKLRKHAESLAYIDMLKNKIGGQHPFIVNQEERLSRLRQTVLLDLNNALKSLVVHGVDNGPSLLGLLTIYNRIGEANEAVAVLRKTKQTT